MSRPMVDTKNKMAPAPKGRLVALASYDIIILAVLMFFDKQIDAPEYAENILNKVLHCNDYLLLVVVFVCMHVADLECCGFRMMYIPGSSWGFLRASQACV